MEGNGKLEMKAINLALLLSCIFKGILELKLIYLDAQKKFRRIMIEKLQICNHFLAKFIQSGRNPVVLVLG